jgi:hypothetical protein
MGRFARSLDHGISCVIRFGVMQVGAKQPLPRAI